MGYFLIYFLEFKTGNEDISSFQQTQFFSESNEEKEYPQYEEIVATYSLLHSSKLFTPFRLIDFIKNGDYTDIVSEINNSVIYAKDKEEKDWEKLWYWQLLDDDDYLELINKVSSSFFTTEDFHITEILHISGILFSLIDSKLYKKKNKQQVIKRAKTLIEKTNLKEFKDSRGFSMLTWGSWQKAYASDKTEEFKSLVEYTRKLLDQIKQDKSGEAIEDIFYSLSNENVDELYQKTKDYNEDLGNIIERTPMLANLNPKKFTETLLRLNNDGLFRIRLFFEYRYFPEKTYSNVTIEDYQRQEKGFLISIHTKIAKEINSRKNNKRVIRKHVLGELNNMIGKSIKRL